MGLAAGASPGGPPVPSRPRLTPNRSRSPVSATPRSWPPRREPVEPVHQRRTSVPGMADLTIGYAAMLEQFGPQEVLGYQVLAEQHGFSGSMAADHFQPWVPAQGEASFVWNVLTAIGERTRGD